MIAPYTYFTSSELHLGEISLECSRPGASAVALWATQKLLPLVRGGEFAAGLEACREAAVSFARAARRRFPMARAFSSRAGHRGLGASRRIRPPRFGTVTAHLYRGRQARPAPRAGPLARGVFSVARKAAGPNCGPCATPGGFFGSRDSALPAFCLDEARTPRMAEPDSGYTGRGVPGCGGRINNAMRGEGMYLKTWLLPARLLMVKPAGMYDHTMAPCQFTVTLGKRCVESTA